MTAGQVPQGGATSGMQIAHQCSPWGQAVAETISWLASPSSSLHPFSASPERAALRNHFYAIPAPGSAARTL